MICRIRRIFPASRSEWDAHWEACDHATFFESSEWAEIWQQYTRGAVRPAAKLVEFSDGARAVLPFSERVLFRGWVRSYVFAPAGTFGGWISREALTGAHARLLASYLSAHPADLLWRINPYTPHLSVAGESGDPSVTYVLCLDEDFESILRRWRRATRRAVGRARSAGVTIERASTEEDWRAYYAAYQDSLRRWGPKATSRYEWRLFELLFLRGSPRIVLWLARSDGEVVSGALCFYAKRHVVYWHGATKAESFSLRPVPLLFHDAVLHASSAGYRWFDFNPSGGHETVDHFKRGFGTEALSCPVIRRESARQRALRRLARLSHDVNAMLSFPRREFHL